VVRGLGLDAAGLDRPLATLSGGEITKLALAGALLAAPDLLLLDEPTNNLDAQSVRFLSGWLRDSPAAILPVSHDREHDPSIAVTLAAGNSTGQWRSCGNTRVPSGLRNEASIAVRNSLAV
jgi:energy-coupling factor transporter ATP-binding protein EcfA2